MDLISKILKSESIEEALEGLEEYKEQIASIYEEGERQVDNEVFHSSLTTMRKYMTLLQEINKSKGEDASKND